MNYKDTLNLPKTDFSMKADLPNKEPIMLKSWQECDIYNKIKAKQKGKPKYILHDGPPYANGHIHMGHVLNKLLKDIVLKYKTIKGFDCPYVPGWDCHGMPIEHQLLKDLEIEKTQIDQVEFRRKARNYALKFVDVQKKEFQRLGIFGDWNQPYLTLDPIYEAEILRSFADLSEKGYIYKDLKPVNWCISCETALAEAEVEYEQHQSHSIYVKFKASSSAADIEIDDKTFFVIWTTTPWTLFANVAIAVHPDLEYAVVEVEKEKWIIASSLVENVFAKTDKKFSVIKKVRGRELENSIAQHPFIDRESKVVLANYVSCEDGTGCVHTAPGHGQDDYLTGKKYDLELIMPVKNNGCFDDTCGKLSNMNVFHSNKHIIEMLKQKSALVFDETIEHSYPHCWRCKQPIIFRATEQWFLNVDHNDLRNSLLKVIKKDVSWHPQMGQSRITAMVENRPDWCLSRQRFWGVPIPVFFCKDCGKRILDTGIIMSIADEVEKEGVDIWFKRTASELLPKGYKCENCQSSNIDKEHDILDVWFESGVSHQSVLKRRDGLCFPADLYLEGSDQHRGWFQSSIITSLALEKKAPFKDVLTHGFLVDGEGKKMSKSIGNVISPFDVMKKYGADILRLWVASSNYSDDIRISEEILTRTADAYRKIRNTFRFLLSNLNDFDPKKDQISLNELDEIDRWMLSKLGVLIKEVEKDYDNFVFHRVYRKIYGFCVTEVSSIYLDILKDRLYTYKKDGRYRRSTQTVLFKVLESLVKILSPLLPFTTEEIWKSTDMFDAHSSVHLSQWPSLTEDIDSWIDHQINEQYDVLLGLREDIQKALELKRGEGVIGSGLEAKVKIGVKDKRVNDVLNLKKNSLPMFFIVSQVEILDKCGIISDKVIEVQKADGTKCERCWIHSDSVGRSKEHPLLCEKCVTNL
ncbi:MAG: isoleucine--tRNA ligase [Candidatus Omnitrophica bacterium]|nr:isoleucine--tRNA ligase [Candidatus Omnitrophota bacterium]